LAENGEILELQFGKKPAMYEFPAERHPHFICNRCEKIFNLEVPIENLIIRGVEKNEGHQVDSLEIVIYGLCNECKNQEQERV
jgi:Fe2+ or Zn2+ uptake regulation protein